MATMRETMVQPFNTNRGNRPAGTTRNSAGLNYSRNELCANDPYVVYADFIKYEITDPEERKGAVKNFVNVVYKQRMQKVMEKMKSQLKTMKAELEMDKEKMLLNAKLVKSSKDYQEHSSLDYRQEMLKQHALHSVQLIMERVAAYRKLVCIQEKIWEHLGRVWKAEAMKIVSNLQKKFLDGDQSELEAELNWQKLVPEEILRAMAENIPEEENSLAALTNQLFN